MNKMMITISIMLTTAWLGLAMFFLSSCATPPLRPTGENVRTQPVLAENVYLANNIHAEERTQHLQASYANWTNTDRHNIIPVNTPVAIHDWPNALAIRTLDEERLPIIFEYDQRRMRMSKQEYIEEITSQEQIDLETLSEIDRQGIEIGRALEGMSKDGVRIALGYPARHETPRLEDDVWTYWRNRWIRYTVVFDQDGEVIDIRD